MPKGKHSVGDTPGEHIYWTKLVAVYLVMCAAIMLFVLHLAHGFEYVLDDPYIHLALAQRMLHGHYGINTGEAASPASSIAWPLLLMLFSTLAFSRWVPFAWNLIFGCGCCYMVGLLLERWHIVPESPQKFARSQQWVMAVLLVVCGNFVGLTFVGMEHLLQVMLMVGCAYGLLETYAGRRMPGLVLWMAVLAPSVRYEDLAFTLAIALACWFQRSRSTAVLVLAGGTVPLILFGFFLHRHGLPMLPTSVLVKAAAASTAGSFTSAAADAMLPAAFAAMLANLKNYVVHRDRWSVDFTMILLVVGLVAARADRPKRTAILSTLVAGILLMMFGPFGWFYRYDVALRLFLLLIVLVVFASRQRHSRVWTYALLLLSGYTYYHPLQRTAYAATQIHRQQYQMHRFEEEYYRKPVAVNDLGWVSFNHDPNVYVLDLAGLGSLESSRRAVKNAAFLSEVTHEHNIGLAMIYDDWFPDRPRDWVRVGVLHEAAMKYEGTVASPNVSFYATGPGSVEEIRQAMLRFRETVPEGVSVRIE